MKSVFFTIFLVLSLGFSVFAQKHDWQRQIAKIQPLVTSETQVERYSENPSIVIRISVNMKLKTEYFPSSMLGAGVKRL
jgi:hypothetical protein